MADVITEIEDGGLKRTLKDLFAGATGGIAQVLLGELLRSCAGCLIKFLITLNSKWGGISNMMERQKSQNSASSIKLTK